MSRVERVVSLLHQIEDETRVAFDEHTQLYHRMQSLEAENEKLRELFYEAWDWMQRASFDGSIRVYEMDEIGTKAVKLGFPDYELGIEVKPS